MNQLYWHVYLNLEKEFLRLADTIFVNDNQQEIYSMKIADLLIRTVIEIEALAKELYLANGGPVLPDEEMFFDTVCMKHLDNLWNLDKKMVLVVSPSIYYDKDENKVLTPLHKATKRGSSSADWNKAYQAVKHNRVRELSKGNIKHFLHGLAALYVLNLYYREERIINLPEKEKHNVDPSFGSSLFAVKIHKVGGFNVDNGYIKNADYDECVYIEDYESASKQKAMEAMALMTDYINNASHVEYEKLIREKFNKGETPTKEWIEQHQIDVIKKVLPVKDINLGKLFNNAMTGIRYEIVLNKHQY